MGSVPTTPISSWNTENSCGARLGRLIPPRRTLIAEFRGVVNKTYIEGRSCTHREYRTASVKHTEAEAQKGKSWELWSCLSQIPGHRSGHDLQAYRKAKSVASGATLGAQPPPIKSERFLDGCQKHLCYSLHHHTKCCHQPRWILSMMHSLTRDYRELLCNMDHPFHVYLLPPPADPAWDQRARVQSLPRPVTINTSTRPDQVTLTNGSRWTFLPYTWCL